jgi:hypothetical protein
LLQSYTQYIPLPITDLDSWLKTPSIYVFDCSAAGIIVKAFLEVCYMFLINIFFLCLKLKVIMIYVFCFRSWTAYCLLQRLDWSSTSSASSQKDCILLAACEAHQTLPQSAEFPADVFTACLTTPIKMALHWFSLSPLPFFVCTCVLVCTVPYLLTNFLSMLCLHEDMPINHAGFVSEHYSVVLWITLLLTKFLEGKMTVKQFSGSSIGFLLL